MKMIKARLFRLDWVFFWIPEAVLNSKTKCNFYLPVLCSLVELQPPLILFAMQV